MDNNAIQLVIPMAGKGSRFTDAGYEVPKPLLDVHGVPMYQIVVANLLTSKTRSVTIVCPAQWGLKSQIESTIQKVCAETSVIEIDYTTGGPAETVAIATEVLDLNFPMVVANSDQYVASNQERFDQALINEPISGLVLCMRDNDPKWSYVELNEKHEVKSVVEKQVISNLATVGIYGFKSVGIFMEAREAMKRYGNRVNNEWYVGPIYTHMNRAAGPVIIEDLGPVSTAMFGMGIPRDYEAFIKTPESVQAALLAKRLFS